MDEVDGDLFVGEAKLFFANPRRQWRVPLRVETAGGTNTPVRTKNAAVSFTVHIDNPDLIMLCESRMNSARVTNALCASDIGDDTDISPYAAENTGRWTSVRETTDGRHWSDGERHWKRMLDADLESFERDKQHTDSSFLACLNARLPPHAVEAVRDGRAIVISRVKSITEHVTPKTKRSADGNGHMREIDVRRLCKSFGNQVYALRCPSTTGHGQQRSGDTGEIVALLFVGRFWPKEVTSGRDVMQPVLTVARTKSVNASSAAGGRVFCICVGNHLTKILDGRSVEDISKTKRHYEGYFDDGECESFLKTPSAK